MAKLINIKPGVPQKMDSTDHPTFEEWLKRVDAVLNRACGFTSADLPDCKYMDWYDQRLRPVRAAQRAIKKVGEY